MTQAMSEHDLPSLIAEQRQLLLEESVILELLKKVKDEIHKLQVEQLQLDSMIMAEYGNRGRENSSSSISAVTTDMDSVEKVNQEKLDLTVSSSLNKMLQGQFYAEEEEEEEEENCSQAGVDEEEFILPL